MKRNFFWLLLIVAAFGAAAAIRLVAKSGEPLPKAGPVNDPPRSPFKEPIGARGLVESVDENVRLAPAVGALIAEVLVKVGDPVEKGATLVKQDTREAVAMVAAQEAEIAALRTQLQEAEVTLAEKRDMWSRIEKLNAGKVASVEESQRTLFAAKSAEAAVESMKAKITGAEAQLTHSKVRLDLLTIRAPRAGQVLQVNVRPGEFADIKSNEPLILLGQSGRLQLRADIDEVNASRFKKEMPAIAKLKGRDEPKIPLTFIRIEPYILPKKSLTGDSNERVDTRVLQIIYQFTPPDGVGIYVGQQMDVFIDGGK